MTLLDILRDAGFLSASGARDKAKSDKPSRCNSHFQSQFPLHRVFGASDKPRTSAVGPHQSRLSSPDAPRSTRVKFHPRLRLRRPVTSRGRPDAPAAPVPTLSPTRPPFPSVPPPCQIHLPRNHIASEKMLSSRRALGSLRSQIEADAFVDEFQRVGLFVIDIGFDDAGLHHLVEEILHPLVGHRADA